MSRSEASTVAPSENPVPGSPFPLWLASPRVLTGACAGNASGPRRAHTDEVAVCEVGRQSRPADRDRVTLVADRHFLRPVLVLGGAVVNDLRPRRRHDVLDCDRCLLGARSGVTEPAEGGERADHEHRQRCRE